MNQALSFGLLFTGGILLTSALKNQSLRDVVQGKPGTVSQTGIDLGQLAGSGVSGLGANVQGAINSVGTSVAGGASGYVNPFAKAHGLSPGRIDMGQDFGLTPGSPILAPGRSKVLGISPNWYSGQPYIALQLLDGPLAGRNYYVAEQITPAVRPGMTIAAGTPIGYYASHGTGLEMGWAGANWAQTLAQATTGYHEGQHTTAGQAFHDFLHSIGAL